MKRRGSITQQQAMSLDSLASPLSSFSVWRSRALKEYRHRKKRLKQLTNRIRRANGLAPEKSASVLFNED